MTKLWKKVGLIYALNQNQLHPKLISHTANPLPIHLDGNVFRIFFSSRDVNNNSSVSAVDVDIVLRKVVKEYSQPFFSYGPVDSFFSHGISIGNYYKAGDVCYMLFMGWKRYKNRHWQGEIGRLIITPKCTLELDSLHPLLALNVVDPISLSYPWVLPNPLGGFDMWYGSTISWDAGNGEMLHVIKHASSTDGHNWDRTGLSVPYKQGYAQAFSRPSVIRNAGGDLEMWFSYRGGPNDRYRIGYAKSNNGLDWSTEFDKAGIAVSENGWDSEMIEYPYVFNHNGQRYMLYNGNGFGKTGFGMAILEDI